MKIIEVLKNYKLITAFFAVLFLASCSSDDDAAPEEENEVEIITDLTLVFTNSSDPSDVVMASAQDPDGAGVQELEVLDAINLTAGAEYILTLEILNALDSEDIEDITEEIVEEADEHQFFFSFTEDAFANPNGDGNIDNSSDPLNYNDEDENGNPIGLSTSWTTAATATADGTFTIVLQHQPDIKSATTGATDGDTDINVRFALNIQ